MRQTLLYFVTFAALGLVTVWGSENFFWSAPPEDLTLGGWLMTWLAYALASGTVLSAVILTSARGWLGLFLAGVLFGYVVEGVLVGTVYEAFPFQLVWTAMAWHGLITGLCILGLSRASPHWPLGRQVLALLALGVGGALFASFWPTERVQMPEGDLVLLYLFGVGWVVPLANVILDRIKVLPRPPVWVLLLLPVLATALWLIQTAAAPSPQRVAFWPIVGLTLWAMHRLGRAPGMDLRPAPAPWRHVLFPLAPLITTLIAVPLWEHSVELQGNWIIAALTVPLSLGLWLWALWRGWRRAEA